MIPKVIHYCWFGRSEKNSSVLKCIESWKRFCPDYEIIEWNEDNFDVDCIPFVKEAYEAQKWAFVADYARLKVVYENGGIYFDTDVELIRGIDELLTLEGFAGFEPDCYIATGLGFGAQKGQRMIGEMMADYHNRSFLECSDDLIKIACPIINTGVLQKFGAITNGEKQTVEGLVLFPSEYFSPMDSETYITHITENTYSIHHYDASWKGGSSKLKKKIIKAIVTVIGKERFLKLKKKLK